MHDATCIHQNTERKELVSWSSSESNEEVKKENGFILKTIHHLLVFFLLRCEYFQDGTYLHWPFETLCLNGMNQSPNNKKRSSFSKITYITIGIYLQFIVVRHTWFLFVFDYYILTTHQFVDEDKNIQKETNQSTSNNHGKTTSR